MTRSLFFPTRCPLILLDRDMYEITADRARTRGHSVTPRSNPISQSHTTLPVVAGNQNSFDKNKVSLETGKSFSNKFIVQAWTLHPLLSSFLVVVCARRLLMLLLC